MKKTTTVFISIFYLIFFSSILVQPVYSQQIMLDDESKRTLALVIGISDYKYLNDLQFAHNDAEDFEQFLKAKDGLSLPPSDVVVYTNSHATSSKILYDGFQWLDDELKEGDEAFIFFSGHGEIYNKDAKRDIYKDGYLMTHDSEKDKYETTAVSMEFFLKRLNKIAHEKNVTIRVIMDVCHAGIELSSGGIITLLGLMGEYDNNKLIVITSCDTDEESYEYEALQNGCFSYFFLKGCQGSADLDKDYKITLKELKKYSAENVERYVKANNDPGQEPQFKGDDAHLLARAGNQNKPGMPDEFEKVSKGKSGAKKGIDKSAPAENAEVNRLLKKIQVQGLSSQEIQVAYQLYLEQPEKTSAQRSAKRKMKRDLVAVMVEKADEALTTYFDKEGEMTGFTFSLPVSEYYLKSAELLGKDHLLYKQLLGKYFFMEALRLKALHPNDPKVMDYLNSSLTMEPDASYTLNELGNIYFEKKNYEAAKEYYQKAYAISPTWGKNLVKANTSLQQKQAAQKLFTAKSPYDLTPASYETPADPKLASRAGNASAPAAPDKQNHVFHIQLASASKVNRDEFRKLEDLGPINPEFNPEKNMISTRMGPFDSEKEAKLKLKKVRERGFKDAFLVEAPRDTSFQKKLEEKRVELKKEQAAAMPYQVRIASVSTYNETDFASLKKIGNVEAEPVTVNGKTLFRVLMHFDLKAEAIASLNKVKKAGFPDAYLFENKNQDLSTAGSGVLPASFDNSEPRPTGYKIRVATVTKLVENQFSNLENLGQIYMDVVHDKGLIRISLGEYPSKTKATEVLGKVKKLGYKDAFIEH